MITSKFGVVLILKLFLLVLIDEGQTQYREDFCRIGGRRGRRGYCMVLSQCPFALQQIRRNGRPQICGYVGREPIVCCPRVSEDISQPTTPPPNGLKSKQKCQQYIDAKYEEKPYFFTTVVGGKQASAKEFPHMAALGFGDDSDIQYQCGGTLISEQFVVTAAHCLYSQELGDVKFVRLGDLDLKSKTDDAQPQDFRVIQVTAHPEYKPPSQYNDIALIKLDRPALFSPYVKPACLQTELQLPSDFSPIATGWGRLGFTADSSDHLMKVTVQYFSNEQCKQVYANIAQRRLSHGIDDNSQICAGGVNESKDTCQGDSGGPLQIKHAKNPKQFIVIGVTSFGKGCGIENVPGVYTRVSTYVSWIEEIVWPDF